MTEFSDQYGRIIDYLRISITDRCNLRCRYCMPAEGVENISHDEILSYEEIAEIVAAGADLGIKKIRLTGGEPLVRKGVPDLVRMLNQIAGIEEIAMTTNGILLPQSGAELVKAGLERVNISLDTLQEEKFKKITRFEQYQEVLTGIETALEVGLAPVKINVVVMKGINDDEILDFVNLSKKYNVHVRFIEFMPSGNKKLEQEKRYLGIDKVKEIIKKEEQLLPTEFNTGNGPAYYYQVGDSLGSIGFINAISNHFCSDCNRLRLTATGQLRPCLFSEEEIDLSEALAEGKEAIKNKFIAAVGQKPVGHSLNNETEFLTNMSQIGG
ncbi:GTP 3',8-cyclase MoaA [Halanaerobacter jeridensis]|uniref:GTP 3',8-cyclase n=1 Tax=Halanaerobacter jeridensis TaxID=706427 RepID=A0A938XYK6_9FIRM|nr:GTP 3',8-cyclase MoaA [Halanaerobacter jeridensis]MBM7557670.1 cyclic pyranopterin phosphate synthase [Halanaerobacter jeridensis]